MPRWTDTEIEILKNGYTDLGPTALGKVLNRPMKSVSKKAIQLGLERGVGAGNQARANRWSFTKWTRALGYLVGVYLGDGNVWIAEGVAYFKLSVVDKDFAVTVAQRLHEVTGYEPTWSTVKGANSQQPQYIVRLCNKDFATWLVEHFGPANHKHITILPDSEANRGLLEGLNDSEGTKTISGYLIRMNTDLSPLAQIFKQLDIQRLDPHHNRKGLPIIWTDHKVVDRLGRPQMGFQLHFTEWHRAGLTSAIARKRF